MAALAVALLSSAPAGARPEQPAAACAGASASPLVVGPSAARGPLLCVINAERAQHGLPPVRWNRRLALAAKRHGRDMVRRNYFSHRSADGRRLGDRVRNTGYLRGARANWVLGENLAWDLLDDASPRQIVDAWLRSPSHRRVMLRRGFREVGLAVVHGAPVTGAGESATYVADFGAP